MNKFYTKAFSRNQLYALAVFPPTIFMLSGHVILGLVFLLCVVAGRFSRPRASRSQRKNAQPLNS